MRRINSEAHRHLLQLIISKGFLSEGELGVKLREFKEKYDNIEAENYRKLRDPKFQPILTDTTLDQYIGTLNTQIRDYYIRIEKIKYKLDGIFYLGIRNIDDSDEIGKMTTDYEPEQIKYFEIMLKEIRRSDIEGLDVTEMDLFNARPNSKTLSFAETTFRKLVLGHWIHHNTERNRVWFGIRTCISLPRFLESDPDEDEDENGNGNGGENNDEQDGEEDDGAFIPPPPAMSQKQRDDEEEVEGEGEL